MHRIRLLVVLAFAALLVAAPASPNSSSGVVVSQVYAGGGNSGASFTNDFVELLNTGSASVTIDGWTVQYASAAGTSWQSTPLAGSIAPASDLLIGTASTASGSGGDAWPMTVGFTAPLPVVAPGHYSATLTYTLVGS